MAAIPPIHNEDDLRDQLQSVLDEKEKQLQLAGTLGQRILAQQMELEERINQLHLSTSELGNGGRDLSEETKDKLKELGMVLSSWETENSDFFSRLAAKTVGFHGISLPICIKPDFAAKL